MHHLTDLADGVLLFVVQFHNQIPFVSTQRLSSSALLIILVGNKGPKFCRGPSPRWRLPRRSMHLVDVVHVLLVAGLGHLLRRIDVN